MLGAFVSVAEDRTCVVIIGFGVGRSGITVEPEDVELLPELTEGTTAGFDTGV